MSYIMRHQSMDIREDTGEYSPVSSRMSYIMRHQSMDIREDTGEYSQSLNRERRKRELQRITRENQKILARIQAAEPTYDHLEWAEHERNHEETMKRLCELPLVIHGDPAPQDEDEGY